jgi:hypothetical protein
VVATDQTDGNRFEVATRAVKMTFRTDRPLYPYREPSPPATPAAPDANRLLRVFFLSNTRYAATLGDQPWSAQVLYAGKIEQLPGELAPLAGDRPFATVFADERSPRRGVDELYFAESADASEIRQPPIVIIGPHEIVIPIEGLALISFLVIGLVRRRRGGRRVRATNG